MVALITNKDIAKYTPINGNVDISKYAHIIREIQMFNLEPRLGTKLYKKIEQGFVNKDLQGDYKVLYENFIIPFLCYDLTSEFILTHSFSIGNGGIFKHNPENGIAVDKNEVDYLANKYKLKVENVLDRMLHFLCKANISEYRDQQEEIQDVKPIKNNNLKYGGWQI